MGRRMRTEGSVYPRGDLWCGQVDMGYDPRTGKRRRKTIYTKTQEAAVAEVRKIQRDIAAGLRATANPTVEWWLRYWLDDIIADRVKPRTLATYRAYTEKHLIPALGRYKLDKLDSQHIRQLHRAMADKSSTTRMHAHRILSTALEAAVKERRLTVNIARIVDAPRPRESTRRGMTGTEAHRVLDAALSVDNTSRWWAALMTGARQGELLGLRWDHVDLDAAEIDLAWALQQVPRTHGCGARPARGKPWPCGKRFPDDCPKVQQRIPEGLPAIPLEGRYYLMRPKTTGSIRVVPLLPGLVHQLRAHRAADTGPNPHGLVWHRPDGRPLDPRQDLKRWNELLEAAKVPAMTLHEARHTAASLLLEAGVDPKVIGEILGHSLVVTTRAYQTVSKELARRAVEKLGEQLGLPAA